MVESFAFQTKARTVDHLGREQIADCPTAISELWKNSYDAYARNVDLSIFAGEEPVAVMTDDGHGMSSEEFVSRWLVVGTDSKVSGATPPIQDMNGLKPRPKQGQKGIGRLSSANLGPVLLLISKRQDASFVAALIDWRLFENPYLNLSDIEIPLVSASHKDEIFPQLPEMFATLLTNVEGDEISDRGKRIARAWSDYDDLWLAQSAGRKGRPSEKIKSTIIRTVFSEDHVSQWPVWTGASDSGTALLISQINFDLKALLNTHEIDAAARGARQRFFETLSSFVDPFIDAERPAISGVDPKFNYSVKVWRSQDHIRDNAPHIVVGAGKEFSRRMIEPMEHVIDGFVNIHGVFKGRVKSFGEWRTDDAVIPPPDDLVVPEGYEALLGPVDLFIASMEFRADNTTHSPAEYQRFKDLAERYAGFMVFRDGLRVLPYGREDNDFFEIEMRRSKNAGREFWNQRQMFGRLAISRDNNPNLKDKAGREGLLDNRAAKTLKILISNILMQSARQFFGSSSKFREEVLPEIKKANAKTKAKAARNELRRKQRENFQQNLKKFRTQMPEVISGLESLSRHLTLTSEAEVEAASDALIILKEKRAGFRLGEIPDELGPLENSYATFKHDLQRTQNLVSDIEVKIQGAVESILQSNPLAAAERQLARHAGQIHRRIRAWKQAIEDLQRREYERTRSLFDQRNKILHAQIMPVLDRVRREEITLSEAFKIMEAATSKIEEENEGLFVPYISALESLAESIDLETLATVGMEEESELRRELERLNSLAQLGITVEIVGHDLEDYDQIIGTALERLPPEVKTLQPMQDIKFGLDGLTDQLRFLSPLKLSGNRQQEWITGHAIWDYVHRFFGPTLARLHIEFSASEKFKTFRVYDQPSRLFPVFINLVNNSRYWVGVQREGPRQILLDVADGRIYVADTGPGVSAEDQSNLFSLFFTRKSRGGRGVGLYLCRANLAAGGHSISYEHSKERKLLSGANFVIVFRGAEFNHE